MNDEFLEQLLREGESASLDYKREHYPFVLASDDDKSELLKDIIAFANGWRHADAYILVGVEEVPGARSNIVGVANHIAENDIQQFVNTKTNRPVTFSYRAYPFEGKQIGVLTIPQQERPVFLTKDFGRLKKNTVYYRQGTSTAIANPDDIARMATPPMVKKLLEGKREETPREQVRVQVGASSSDGFFADLYNAGELPIYIKKVALARQPNPDQTVELPLFLGLPIMLADGHGTIIYQARGEKTCDLQARKEARFLLTRKSLPPLQQFVAHRPEEVWLTVGTFGEEIYRSPSGQVIPLLRDVVQMWLAQEEVERPKVTRVVFLEPKGEGAKREVGSMKATKVRKGGKVGIQLEPDQSGFSLGRDEGTLLAEDLATGKCVGATELFEWRVE
jgi:hypothetical protein